MASDNEHRLVSKVIRDRDIVPALQRGVTNAWFLDDDNKRVWDFVRKHYGEYSEVPTAVTVKERTSNFAERFGLDIAVNGEAGTTPGLTAPLGQWSGMYVVNGKVIYNEDSKKRPFMFFNREMKCFYSPEAEEIRSINNEMYNVIWGRFDLVRNGKLMVSPSDHTQNTYYPRTAVGIDKSGKKAYLLVADGRDPYYSMGLTMNLCGKVLLNFGCHSAMACDQGGSSNMYSRELGVFTQPGDGIERKVYTHLGFKRN